MGGGAGRRKRHQDERRKGQRPQPDIVVRMDISPSYTSPAIQGKPLLKELLVWRRKCERDPAATSGLLFDRLTDQIGGFFRNHDCGRIGVAGRDQRHDRGIDNTQTIDATDPQPLIHHGQWIVACVAHLAGAGPVVHRLQGLACIGDNVVVRRDRRSRRDFFHDPRA